MATRPIVPRANGEGSLGVNTAGNPKYWGNVFTNKINDIPVENLGSVPLGFTTPLLQSTAPDGWLACQGAEVSRATYPDLWNLVSSTNQFITEQEWQNKNVDGDINIGWFSSGDGTTTFRLPRIVGSGELTEVKRFTTAGDGSFVAPVTGVYKITLVGGGGGGAASGGFDSSSISGGGGGHGGHGEFYERLTAGVSYAYVIGAGGAGGAAQDAHGSDGGASSITINTNAYVANGGQGGFSGNTYISRAGQGGTFTVNGTTTSKGSAGGAGAFVNAANRTAPMSGVGGGDGGASIATYTAVYGGGGAGGDYTNSNHHVGGAGGDGYIEFAYNPVPQYWYVRAFGSATNQGTIDITELANMLNAKADTDSVLPLIGGGVLTGNNLTWNGADLGGASIVAQSLDVNGYVKYSNGLIVQWGTWTINTGAAQGKYFPIQFSSTNYRVVCQSKVNNFTPPSVYSKYEHYVNMTANVSAEYDYIAIGY